MTDAAASAAETGRAGARDIRVWDPLVRLVHWSVALAILFNGFLNDPEKAPHEWIGYAAATFVGLRLLWGLIGPRPARFAAFPPSPRRALAHLREIAAGSRDTHLSHNPLGALMVYALWSLLAVLAVTGYMMGTYRYFGIDWVEEVHEMAVNLLFACVALHVAGVLFDSRRTGVPLVRAMITGRKRVPADIRVE